MATPYALTLLLLLVVYLKCYLCINFVNTYKLVYKRHGNDFPVDFNTQRKSDLYFNAAELVEEYGYPVETHIVTTKDGYLLTAHRIPGSPKAPPQGVKTPVLVQHGLFGSSDTFVTAGPEIGLGFLLADEGYDVWLNNARGNFYSSRHKTLSPKDPKFWDFSWHEMGVYDLPAVIDYILQATNHTQLFYIGHSMGATVFFVLTSCKPEYNQKIRLMVALAPPVDFQNGFGNKLIRLLSPQMSTIYRGFKKARIYQLFPRHTSVSGLIGQLCRDGQPTFETCLLVYFNLFGTDREELNSTMVPVIFAHLLAGASLNAFFHFVQNFQTGRFQQFDRSVKTGTLMPEYDLSKVTVPVSLHYALNDPIVHPEGVVRLSRTLPNVVNIVRVPGERTSHIDFVFANSVKHLVYDKVFKIMQMY